MTSYDHYIVMTNVGIAELKARLSEYLRQVRNGQTVTVLHRDMAIARIVPAGTARGTLTVRSRTPGAPPLHKVRLPRRTRISGDIVDLLMQERQGER